MGVVDAAGKSGWRGMAGTHPQRLAAALKRVDGKLATVGPESGPFTPHLFRPASGDRLSDGMHRRAAGGRCNDAIKSRRIKSGKAGAFALAGMPRTRGFPAVRVTPRENHL